MVVAAHPPIPAVARVKRILGETANPSESFVGQTNNVAIEIVARIAQMPQEGTAALAGSVPIGRNWFISVSEPPDRVEFLAGAEPVRLLGNVNTGYRIVVSDPNSSWHALISNLETIIPAPIGGAVAVHSELRDVIQLLDVVRPMEIESRRRSGLMEQFPRNRHFQAIAVHAVVCRPAGSPAVTSPAHDSGLVIGWDLQVEEEVVTMPAGVRVPIGVDE